MGYFCGTLPFVSVARKIYALGVDDVQKAGGVPKTGTAALYSFVLNKGVGQGFLGKASFTARYGRKE